MIHKEMNKTIDYIIYTDGGCAFNPGGAGGCATVIVDTETGEIIEKSRGYFSTTNNRMEIMAFILALEDLPDVCSIDLYSDSQYLVSSIEGTFRKKKNKDLWAQLDRLLKNKNVISNWVPGHSGIRENERCDQLCLEAMVSSKKIKDIGYEDQNNKGNKRTTSVNRSAMGEMILIPDEFQNERIEIDSVKNYCAKYTVKDECARGIYEFDRSQRRFKDYLLLKSGGIDTWSHMKKDDLINEMVINRGKTYGDAETIWDSICYNIDDEKRQVSCLRWYLRGLPLHDCIRREMVSCEIEHNCY